MNLSVKVNDNQSFGIKSAMLSYTKTRVLVMASIIALLAFVFLWWRGSKPVSTVYFPDGSTAALVDGRIPDIHWRRFERSAPSPTSLSLPKRIARIAIAAYKFHHLRGPLPIPIPNPPKPIDLVGNVRVFAEDSQKTYRVAEELLDASGTNWINFRFGGPRDARSASEWVQANLDCIRTNGVVVSALNPPYTPYSTTLCAVVIDRDTVSILPAHYFGFAEKSITNR